MATLRKGILSAPKGKIGNAVYYRQKGQDIIRSNTLINDGENRKKRLQKGILEAFADRAMVYSSPNRNATLINRNGGILQFKKLVRGLIVEAGKKNNNYIPAGIPYSTIRNRMADFWFITEECTEKELRVKFGDFTRFETRRNINRVKFEYRKRGFELVEVAQTEELVSGAIFTLQVPPNAKLNELCIWFRETSNEDPSTELIAGMLADYRFFYPYNLPAIV